MSKKQAILDTLKKAMGEHLTESMADEVSTYLEELVAARSEAETLDIKEKVGLLTKENAKLKKVVKFQTESFKKDAESFAGELAEAFAQKESILFEELENYKKETLLVVEQTASDYRNMVEGMVIEEANQYRSQLESVMLESAKDFRFEQEAVLAKDVNAYREDILVKLDEFLEAELPNNLPDGLMEAAAKGQALEELVEDVVGVFDRRYISLDESSVEVLKDAHSENEQLAEAFNAKVKEAVSLTAKVRALEKEVKVSRLTEGMTRGQKKRTRKLLESASATDVEKKFDAVKDYIINESVSTPLKESVKKPTRPAQKKADLNEHAQKQVLKIEESAKERDIPKTKNDREMQTWRKSLDRSLRQ